MTSELSTTSASPARSGAVLKSSERTVATTQTGLSLPKAFSEIRGTLPGKRLTRAVVGETSSLVRRGVAAAGHCRFADPGLRRCVAPRSGDSRSAAVEETFMIAPLVIAAPNTLKRQRSDEIQVNHLAERVFGYVQHRNTLAQRRPGQVPADRIDEDADPPHLVEKVQFQRRSMHWPSGARSPCTLSDARQTRTQCR